MRIEIVGSAALPRSWQLRAEDRVRAALGRFSHRLREVRVRLRDANGPRGGVDKHVLAVADLAGAGSIKVRERDTNGKAAIRRALKRLSLALARRLDRRQTLRRRRG